MDLDGSAVPVEEAVLSRISGTYPMLYAFFGADGAVSRPAFARQIDAAVAVGAAGVAVLGLATEVGKLSRAKQRQIVEWVAADLRGRLPLAVTVAGYFAKVPVSVGNELFWYIFDGEPVAENGFINLDDAVPGFGLTLKTPDPNFKLTR